MPSSGSVAEISKMVPKSLEEHILPFNWDVRKVWALEKTAIAIPRARYDYLLNLPLWSSKPNQGMLFDISPLEVVEDALRSPHQFARVVNCDVSYPIDLIYYCDREWILDGVHRLARKYQLKDPTVLVRVHTDVVIPEIKC